MLFLGLTALAVSSLLYNVQSPWLVIVLWGVGSAGMAFTTVGGQGYLTMASGVGILGVASALYNWGYTAGGAVGTPLSTLVLGEDNYVVLGLALAGFTVLPTLVASLLPQLRPDADVEARQRFRLPGVFLRRHYVPGLAAPPTVTTASHRCFYRLTNRVAGPVAWFTTVG
jgi:MFS family permease